MSRNSKVAATQPAAPAIINVQPARSTFMPAEIAASLDEGIATYKALGQHSRRPHIQYARDLRNRPAPIQARGGYMPSHIGIARARHLRTPRKAPQF